MLLFSKQWLDYFVLIALSFLPACYHFLEIILKSEPVGKLIYRHTECSPTVQKEICGFIIYYHSYSHVVNVFFLAGFNWIDPIFALYGSRLLAK